MSNNKKIDRLQKLQTRQAATAAIAQKIQKSIEATKKKQDLQRKILVGTYYLEQAKNNKTTKDLQKSYVVLLAKKIEIKFCLKINKYLLISINDWYNIMVKIYRYYILDKNEP